MADVLLELLEALADTEAMLTQGQRPSGRLRVNLPGRPARLLIIPALPAFCDRYPELDLEIGVSDRPVDLIQEGLDCARLPAAFRYADGTRGPGRPPGGPLSRRPHRPLLAVGIP